MPKLLVDQDGVKTEFDLGGEPLTCGRSKSTDISLSDDQTSREHCRFECEDGVWYVVDLGSSNGTHLNEERVERQELTDGAVVRIGRTHISFVDEAVALAPEEPEPALEIDLSLRANGGPCDGHVFKIEKAVTTFGRSLKCDIVLPETAVTGDHAELIIDGAAARIADKNSRNGVRVNNVHVSERVVEPGDEIRIGSTVFVLFAGDDAAAGLARDLDESVEQDAAPPPRAALLTGRVKVVALIAAVAFLVALGARFLLSLEPGPQQHPDNLLKQNPSFEEPAPSPGKIPGWRTAKGSAGLSTKDIQDGASALRLVAAAGAGDDLSALCWSSPIEVSPRKTYELSALLRNSGRESAALCVAWSSGQHKWLRSLQLGSKRTSDALKQWQRVSETFEPPSWATSARFGCAVIGQGQVKFDGVRLRAADRRRKPKRIAAGRIEFEPAGHGELTMFADGAPLLGRARISAVADGRPAGQSLGALKKGYPEIRSSMIKYVGKLGIGGRAPFSEVLSSDGTDVTLHYNVDASAMRDAVVVLEWHAAKSVLTGPVVLRTIRGQQSVHKAPFENRVGVSSITFFSGSKRIFLNINSPATVTAANAADGGADWRIEFPLAGRNGPAQIALVWRATDSRKDAQIAADLQRAIAEEDAEQFGKAIKAYEEFLKAHPLYAAECARAAARLQEVRGEIASRVKIANSLAARARTSKSEADFAAAERTCESLIKKLEGHKEAEQIARTLAALKRQHQTAVEQRKAKEAASFLASAKRHAASKEFNIARAECQYVIRKFPNTASAKAARALLDKLPPPE